APAAERCASGARGTSAGRRRSGATRRPPSPGPRSGAPASSSGPPRRPHGSPSSRTQDGPAPAPTSTADARCSPRAQVSASSTGSSASKPPAHYAQPPAGDRTSGWMRPCERGALRKRCPGLDGPGLQPLRVERERLPLPQRPGGQIHDRRALRAELHGAQRALPRPDAVQPVQPEEVLRAHPPLPLERLLLHLLRPDPLGPHGEAPAVQVEVRLVAADQRLEPDL